jgi:hypothetical protein
MEELVEWEDHSHVLPYHRRCVREDEFRHTGPRGWQIDTDRCKL